MQLNWLIFTHPKKRPIAYIWKFIGCSRPWHLVASQYALSCRSTSLSALIRLGLREIGIALRMVRIEFGVDEQGNHWFTFIIKVCYDRSILIYIIYTSLWNTNPPMLMACWGSICRWNSHTQHPYVLIHGIMFEQKLPELSYLFLGSLRSMANQG